MRTVGLIICLNMLLIDTTLDSELNVPYHKILLNRFSKIDLFTYVSDASIPTNKIKHYVLHICEKERKKKCLFETS